MENKTYINNEEKAFIIHYLFKMEIPEILNYSQSMSNYIEENRDELKKNWKSFIGFDYWEALAYNTNDVIKCNRSKLINNRNFFAERLAGGQLALYFNHCIASYAERSTNVLLKITVANLYKGDN